MSAVFGDRGHGPLLAGEQRITGDQSIADQGLAGDQGIAFDKGIVPFSVARELGGAFLAVLTAAVVPGLIVFAASRLDLFADQAATQVVAADDGTTGDVAIDDVAPAVETELVAAAVELPEALPASDGAFLIGPIEIERLTAISVDTSFEVTADGSFRVELRRAGGLVASHDGVVRERRVVSSSFTGLTPDTDYELTLIIDAAGSDLRIEETTRFRTASQQ